MRMKLTMIALLAGGLTELAHAWPSGYNSKSSEITKMEGQTKASLISDHEDSRTIWVMPPLTGTTEFIGFQPTANLGFCSGLKHIYAATESMGKKLLEVQNNFNKRNADVDAAAADLVAAQKDQSNVVAKSDYTRELSDLSADIQDLDDRAEDTQNKLKECDQDCDALRDELKIVYDEGRELRKQYNELRKQNVQESRLLEAAQRKVELHEKILHQAKLRASQEYELMEQINAQIITIFNNQAQLAGGSTHAEYKTGWLNLMASLSKKYPNLNFLQIPTYDVKLNFNPIPKSNSLLASALAAIDPVRGYSVAGLPMPDLLKPNLVPSIPEVVSADVHLNLLGACPLAYGEDFIKYQDIPNPKIYSFSMEYAYPRVFKYKVTASYNLYQVYERIMKKTKKGGFFYTKTKNQVVEDIKDKETFKIAWEKDDPKKLISLEDRAKIENTLKQDLVHRVLQRIGKPIFDETAARDTPALPGIQDSGATVLAKGLGNICGFNIYCQVGKWVILGADSIFGRKNAEAHLRKAWDVTSTEVRSDESVTLVPGMASFSE